MPRICVVLNLPIHRYVKEHGAVFAEVIDAKELGTLFDELLSLECFLERYLAPGL